MKKRKIGRPKLKKLKEKLDQFSGDFSSSSIRQKYKSISLLEKTKNILKTYSSLEETYLPPEDLSDIQSELAKISADIKAEPKKEMEWEPIKKIKIKAIPERILINFKEYWISKFCSLLKLYSNISEINNVLQCLKSPGHLQYPVLSRLYKKIKSIISEENISLMI